MGLVLIHSINTGQFKHSLYLSNEISGRGRSINTLDIKHIPDGSSLKMNNNNSGYVKYIK